MREPLGERRLLNLPSVFAGILHEDKQGGIGGGDPEEFVARLGSRRRQSQREATSKTQQGVSANGHG